jgi:hypothetical protein
MSDPDLALSLAEVATCIWSNLYRLVAGIGISLVVYIIWHILGRCDKWAGMSAASRAAAVVVAGKRKRHWHCRGFILSIASYTHVLIAFLKGALLVGAFVMVVYIFGNTIPAWVSVPTFLAFAGFGFSSSVTQYAAGITNKLHSTTFIGRLVSMNAGYSKCTGVVISMDGCVVLQEPETLRIHTIPHTTWINSTITIEDGKNVDITTFSI